MPLGRQVSMDFSLLKTWLSGTEVTSSLVVLFKKRYFIELQERIVESLEVERGAVRQGARHQLNRAVPIRKEGLLD